MANLPLRQYQASSAFDGTDGKGLFKVLGDATLGEISIICTGGVSKNVTINKVLKDGTITSKIYEKLATTVDSFVIAGPIRLVDDEWLEIKVSAGAPIFAQIVKAEVI